MENSKDSNIAETWVGLLLGVLAIVALKSIFENDNSKIISKQGKKILSDEEKMQDINDKIEESETAANNHTEIII
jgi:hypothetical protein